MFRLDPHEPLDREIRRLLQGELKDADAALHDPGEPLAARVHEARKRLKRVRAVLLLVADSGDPKALARLTEDARAASHALAAPRGDAALLNCYRALVAARPASATWVVQRELEERAGRSTVAASDLLEAASNTLRESRGRAKELELESRGFSLIAEGFRATYKKARRALRRARIEASPLALHAFRKHEKRHLYQLRLLEETWPGPLRAQLDELDRLGELLGEHHDSSLLAEHVARIAPDEAGSALSLAIAEQLQDLSARAIELGARCFAESASAITRRMSRYYELARS